MLSRGSAGYGDSRNRCAGQHRRPSPRTVEDWSPPEPLTAPSCVLKASFDPLDDGAVATARSGRATRPGRRRTALLGVSHHAAQSRPAILSPRNALIDILANEIPSAAVDVRRERAMGAARWRAEGQARTDLHRVETVGDYLSGSRPMSDPRPPTRPEKPNNLARPDGFEPPTLRSVV